MSKEEDQSKIEGTEAMIPKREVATKLTYIKLRNWSTAYERAVYADNPQKDGSQLRYEETCLVHVEYPVLVKMALQYVDADGRIHQKNILTGEETLSDPIPKKDLAPVDEDERLRLSRFLAQKLYETAWEIVRSRQWNTSMFEVEGEEYFIAGYESHLASLIAPYRHDEIFLASTAALAAEAQNEGRLTVHSS